MADKDKILSLVKPKAVDKDVVKALRKWLADARAGEFEGVILMGVMADGKTRTSQAGYIHYAPMVYGLELAKAQVIRAALNSSAMSNDSSDEPEDET